MRKLLLLLTILISTTINAKYIQAKLYFEDGTTKQGLAELVKSDDKTINFKSDENAKKEKIQSDLLKKIEFIDEDGNLYEAERLYILEPKVFKISEYNKSKNKKWLYLIYNKNQKIACLADGGIQRNASAIKFPSVSYFYGNKNDDEVVFGNNISKGLVVGSVGHNSMVQNMANKAFTNCPKLIKGIEDTKFEYKKIPDQLIEIFDKINL